MKIAMFLSRFPAVSEVFILNQIVGLIDAGYEVDVFCRNFEKLAIQHEKIKDYRLLERLYVINLKIEHVKLLSRFLGKRLCRAICEYYVARFTKQTVGVENGRLPQLKRYDIIHAQFGTLGTYVSRLKDSGLFQGKLVTQFRGVDATAHVKKHGNDCYDYLFENGDLFLPSSMSLKCRLKSIGCPMKKTEVLYSGMDLKKLDASSVPATRTSDIGSGFDLLSVGRLVEKKGFIYGIRAVAELTRYFPTINYAIIGDGPMRGELVEEIEKLDLQERVTLLGAQTHEEVIRYMGTASVFLAPCVTASNGDEEGGINVVKEASYFRMPVVATEHGGIPEIVVHSRSGFIVAERDVLGLAKAIHTLLENRDMCREFGRFGREHVKKLFDQKNLTDQLIVLYHRLLALDFEGKTMRHE